MLYLPVALFLIGVILLCAELNIPGFGVCGILGITSIVVSSIIIVVSVKFWGPFIVIGEFLLVGGIVYGAWNYMKKHQLQSKLVLEETLNEDVDDISGLDALIGKSGIAKTSLRPFGVACFSGNDIEVYSKGKYIPENTPVRVVSFSGRKVFVEKTDALAN